MSITETLRGKGMDRIPNLAFKMMAIFINLRGKLPNADKRLEKYGIKPGFTVVDYGCGTGNYLKKAAKLAGTEGKVLAVDIHPLARDEVQGKIDKFGLKNVQFIQADGYSCAIDNNSADIIYALDMFHMVKDNLAFLKELHRILKSSGFLIIENGHQPRAEAKAKIENSQLWRIVDENKEFMRCSPK